MKIENYNAFNLKKDLSNTKNKLNDTKTASELLKINKTPAKDKVYISKEAKIFLEEQSLIEKDDKDNEAEMFKDMLRQVKESSDPKNNPYSGMMKCIEIAARIINGDKVPAKDEQFLMENEPKMYTSAVMLRQQKESPKKYDSLLEDEDNKDITSQAEADIESLSVEISSSETEISE
nr:hypothetical protein [Tissierella sp.]